MGAASGTASRNGKELYEFGPFRVDGQREVLLRNGEPVPLTPKVFQILLVLLRHNQQVVAKADLMGAVWPDTFVEEANLSRNIFMLRKALGEDPPDRRYIVTVPGQGYRLAEDVRLLPSRELSATAPEYAKVLTEVSETSPWRQRWVQHWVWIAAPVILLVAVAAVRIRLSSRPPVLTEKDTLVLADFANSTGDPVFDGTLRQGLAVQLEQSPFLSIISEDRIQQTLRLMERAPDARLTPEIAREICERTDSAAVLEGSIARLGSQFIVGLRAENCRTGDTVDREQVQAVRKEDVLDALSQMARRFRTRAGEGLATIEKHDTPLAEATTSSLEALKAYSAAWRVGFGAGSASAVPVLKSAIEIDPKFAMAYAYLGRLYGDIGESALSSESARQAYKLRDRVTDRERFFITANYDLQVTGNLEQARESCELWAQAYPRATDPHALLAGSICQAVGRYEAAVEQGKRAVGLDPDVPFGYSNLAAAYVCLGRLKEAQEILQRASERKLDIPEILVAQYQIAFLRGDNEEMKRVSALGEGRAGAEDWLADLEGSALAYSGHLRAARLMSRRAADLAQQAGQRERLAQYEAESAVREAFFGNVAEARRNATHAFELSSAREVEYGAALALALTRDCSRSEKLANDLERRFPEDTLVRFNDVPTLRAFAALEYGKPLRAIEFVETARPYELGFPGSNYIAFFGSLYPAYVRGMAYLAENRGAQAAAEFQKILDHGGAVGADPVGALARLQLGRAYALSGDTARGKSAFHDFLTLWKDADPNIPILIQAKKEYAQLQ